jgi:hypothetical protein
VSDLEIVARVERRRKWTIEEKAALTCREAVARIGGRRQRHSRCLSDPDRSAHRPST